MPPEAPLPDFFFPNPKASSLLSTDSLAGRLSFRWALACCSALPNKIIVPHGVAQRQHFSRFFSQAARARSLRRARRGRIMMSTLKVGKSEGAGRSSRPSLSPTWMSARSPTAKGHWPVPQGDGLTQ